MTWDDVRSRLNDEYHNSRVVAALHVPTPMPDELLDVALRWVGRLWSEDVAPPDSISFDECYQNVWLSWTLPLAGATFTIIKDGLGVTDIDNIFDDTVLTRTASIETYN